MAKKSQSAYNARPNVVKSVEMYKDGGTISVVFDDAAGREHAISLDGRVQSVPYPLPAGWKPGPRHLYVGKHPTAQGARKIALNSDEEKAIVAALKEWCDRFIPPERQDQYLARWQRGDAKGLSVEELNCVRLLKLLSDVQKRRP